MAFLASFLQYLIEAAILVVVAICGAVVGKKLRDNKDAKAPAGKEN